MSPSQTVASESMGANATPGPNPGTTSGGCTQTIPSDHTAINGVCGATFKDVCVAPYAIVQGPSPQVLIGCGAIQQTIPGGDTPNNNPAAIFKGTFANCNGTIYPYSGKSASNQTGSTSANVVTVAKGGTTGTFGVKNAPWPCMNPDYPTAVLRDTDGSLFAVITQMAGIEQVAIDMRSANPAVAGEFGTTAVEMRVLTDRTEALENLVRRTGLPSLRGITATLVQGIRFGTPLAESMRILAQEMRVERLARLEERAARLPVLLTIPTVLFILPCLLMVIGTPVALRVSDSLRAVFSRGFY